VADGRNQASYARFHIVEHHCTRRQRRTQRARLQHNEITQNSRLPTWDNLTDTRLTYAVGIAQAAVLTRHYMVVR